jgi:hypothetical protein
MKEGGGPQKKQNTKVVMDNKKWALEDDIELLCPSHGVPNMQIKWVFYLSIIGGHKQASYFNNRLDIRTWP